jgi:hypothetical protein
VDDFASDMTSKPVPKRRSRWRIILFLVCAAFTLTVLAFGYAVTLVASAVLKGFGEMAVAVSALIWLFFIPMLIAMIWLLLVVEPIPLFVRFSELMGWL